MNCQLLLDPYVVENCAKAGGAVMKRLKLILGKRQEQLPVYMFVSERVYEAQANIGDAVFAVEHGRYGKCSIKAAQKAFAQMAYGGGHGVIGCAFLLDHARAGFAHIFFDFRAVQLRKRTFLALNAVAVNFDGNV